MFGVYPYEKSVLFGKEVNYAQKQVEISFSDKVNLEMDFMTILVSLISAIVHGVIELIFLQLEAISCKTTLMHYSIICFNARFGWVPFAHKFSSLAGFEGKDSIVKENEQNLNYERMISDLCGKKFRMTFKFSDATL